MSDQDQGGRVYRSAIQIQIGGTRGKRGDAGGSLGLKEVEFKLDIGKRRLPSPDVKTTSVEKERAPEFVVKPRRQFVDEGQNAKFKVAFEGSSTTSLSWSKDGQPLQASAKFKMYEQSGYHYLEVREVSSEDSGMYVGTIHNAAGTDTASAELDVFEKPKLLTRGPQAPSLSSAQEDLDVVIGDRDVRLKCGVTGGDQCTVTWYHNGRELRQGRQHRTAFNGRTASLTLTEIREEDGGMYQCVIANSGGEVKASCTLSVQEGEKLEPPVFIKELQDMEVDHGDKVELIVEVKGSQPVHVCWLHNNCQVTVDTPGYVLRAAHGVHSLLVPQASADSGGEYVCEAYNDYGDTDTFCRLRVKELVDLPDPPEFLTRPKPLTLPERSPSATFTCRVQGHPVPAVWWEHNGCRLSNNERYKIHGEGDRHSLEIVTPRRRDAGHYICHVENKAGSVTHTCSLIISQPSGTNSGTSSGAALDYRALLKTRQRVGQIGQQSSSESERSDKENELRDFRHVLRNNRHAPPPVSTATSSPTTSTTTTTSITTASSSTLSTRGNKDSSVNGTSVGSSVSSITSTSSRPGEVRRQRHLFEKHASPSPERASLTSGQLFSPAGERTSTAGSRTGRIQHRPAHVEETLLKQTTEQRSRSRPAVSRDRDHRDPRSRSLQAESRNSLKVDSVRSELGSDSLGTDFRSVLKKQKNTAANGGSRPAAELPTDTRRSWRRSEAVKEPTRSAHDTRSQHGKTDYRSVLKTRQPENETKAPSVSKDSTSSVHSKADFRTVLAKMKNGGEDKKSVVKTEQSKTMSDRKPVNNIMSKDVSSIKSKFETPAPEFRSVQLKPSRLGTANHSGDSTDSQPVSASSDWRSERTRDRSVPGTTTVRTRDVSTVKASEQRDNSPFRTDKTRDLPSFTSSDRGRDLSSLTSDRNRDVSTLTTPERSRDVSTYTTSERKGKDVSTYTTPERNRDMSTYTTPERNRDMSTYTTPERNRDVSTYTTPERNRDMSTYTTPERNRDMSTYTTPERNRDVSTYTTPERNRDMSTYTTPERNRDMSTYTTPERNRDVSTYTTPERNRDMSTYTTPERNRDVSTYTTPERSRDVSTHTTPERSGEVSTQKMSSWRTRDTPTDQTVPEKTRDVSTFRTTPERTKDLSSLKATEGTRDNYSHRTTPDRSVERTKDSYSHQTTPDRSVERTKDSYSHRTMPDRSVEQTKDNYSHRTTPDRSVERTKDSYSHRTTPDRSVERTKDSYSHRTTPDRSVERTKDNYSHRATPDRSVENYSMRTMPDRSVERTKDSYSHRTTPDRNMEQTRDSSSQRAERTRDSRAFRGRTDVLADLKCEEKGAVYPPAPTVDDSACSQSSQMSDSAISSAFSKLSEFSDLSDSGSPAPEVEVVEPRSRRRLERLKALYGGGGEAEGDREVGEAPSIQQPLEDHSVTYGGQAVLQCTVSGVPEPDINWSVNSKTIKPSRFFQLSYQEKVAQLVVAEAFSEDEGEYTCTATNTAGTDSCSCYLTVEASSSRSSRSGSHTFEGPVSTPPRVLSLTPAAQTVRQGQSVHFQLTFSGEPPPVARWFRAKTALEADDHYNITMDSTSSSLFISAATANDSGRYTVTITNDLGTDLQAANLSVEDVPECPVGKPHVYDVSKQSVSLSWCGPAYDGGSAITHYAIEVRDSGSNTWTTLVPDCQNTSYHALNLKADTSYQFRVRAGNKLGLSEPSLTSDPVVMIDPLHSSEDYESDGCSEVFSPTLDYRDRDELPFEPREVTLTPGRKFEDYYDYLHEVGQGRFGSVYKCQDKKTNKIWAAKVLKVREKDKDIVRQEVAVMNRLAHPKLLMLWDAFEAPRTMVLVMEFVGAGELFERVIREDFVLTERDCVHFVRQICCGVGYMHSQSILHLDLKPENVLCVSDNSNQIKIIDFGLARFHKPGESLQVLSGTPEFVAPEVINYDEISFSTDMWSIGVICYILLSGLSPFQGDNQVETLSNVTAGEFDFDDDSFDDISENAKDFIRRLLVKRKEKRSTIPQCEQHPWLAQEDKRIRCKRLNTDRLRCFMARRKWQKTGTAIRALGRMASLQKLLAGGSTSHSSSSSLSSIPDTLSSLPVSTADPPTSVTTAASKQSSARPMPTSADKAKDGGNTSGLMSPAVGGREVVKSGHQKTDSAGVDQLDSVTVLTRSASPSATGTTAGRSSASAWRRGREDRPVDTSSSSARGARTSQHQQPTVASSLRTDVTDSSPESSLDSVQTSSEPLRRATNIPKTDTTNTLSPSQSPCASLEGQSAEPGPVTAPCFLREMVDCHAFKGDVVRFDVTVTGQPAPQLLWMLEEQEVEEDERHILELGENGQCSLIVRHVTQDDEGEYSCRAVNSQGEATCFAELTIYGMGSV